MKQVLWLGAATVVVLAPFLAKPLHVDDALFYWTARQIAAHPLDPYGFSVNWYFSAEPIAGVARNPPGASYYLALAGALLGWSPLALHVALLLPAIGVVLGTWALGRRLSRRPLLAGLLVLTAPGFLVSATTLMSDVPMLALWLVAMVLWLDGVERDHLGLMLGASVVAGAAVLTKYPGAAVIPLLAAYALLRRGWGRWMLALVPGLALVLAYEWWSRATYGEAHLSEALVYSRRAGAGASVHAGLLTLGFLGGSFLAAAPLLPLTAGRRTTAAVAAIGVAAAGAMAWGGRSWWGAGNAAEDLWPIALHFAVFVAAGAAICALAAYDLWHRRDAGAVFLALWVLGIAVFAGFVNWTNNVRSVLPAIPAAALLVARAVDDRLGSRPLPAAIPAILVASLALAMWVALGDYRLARAQVRAAELVRARTADRAGTLWFQGHWGFQVAMESIGARPTDAAASRFFPGDLIVVPRNNTNILPLPPNAPTRRDRLEVPLGAGGTTTCNRCGAGFYSSDWGPLPYRLDPPPPETYDIVEILPGGD